MKIKRCTVCGKEKPLDNFWKNRKTYSRGECVECSKKIKKERYNKKQNYITCKEYSETHKSERTIRSKRYRENLTDSYVKGQFNRKIETSKIPPELIELKRIIILIRREIRSRRTA